MKKAIAAIAAIKTLQKHGVYAVDMPALIEQLESIETDLLHVGAKVQYIFDELLPGFIVNQPAEVVPIKPSKKKGKK